MCFKKGYVTEPPWSTVKGFWEAEEVGDRVITLEFSNIVLLGMFSKINKVIIVQVVVRIQCFNQYKHTSFYCVLLDNFEALWQPASSDDV